MRDLIRRMQAKIALYLVCRYGDVAYQRMPYEVRSMLQGQEQSLLGWGPVD